MYVYIYQIYVHSIADLITGVTHGDLAYRTTKCSDNNTISFPANSTDPPTELSGSISAKQRLFLSPRSRKRARSPSPQSSISPVTSSSAVSQKATPQRFKVIKTMTSPKYSPVSAGDIHSLLSSPFVGETQKDSTSKWRPIGTLKPQLCIMTTSNQHCDCRKMKHYTIICSINK